MTVTSDFELTRPDSVTEALARKGESATARFVAGGTDLIPNLRRGIVATDLLISLADIAEMRQIEATPENWLIGAGVTLSQIAENQPLISALPALSAASKIAGPAHRETATIGGNLCLDTRCLFYNQSEWWRRSNAYCLKLKGDICHVAPQGGRCRAAFSGDLAPALMVLDAELEIAAPSGRRWQKLTELYSDDGADHLTLADNELLVGIRIARTAEKLRSGYEKARLRKAIDFPLTGVAVALQRAGDDISLIRVAVTGTNSMPLLITGTGDLIGQGPDAAFDKALEKLIGAVVKPMRTTLLPGNYRRHVTNVLAKRLVKSLYHDQS